MQYDKKISAFFWIPYQSNPSMMVKRSYVHSLLKLLSKVNVLLHGKLLHPTVQLVVPRLKVLILIIPTVQWHMVYPSRSTFLSWIFIDSLPGFWMSVIHHRIQMFPFMVESVSVQHPIIWTGLKYIIPMFLSIYMTFHSVFDA